MTKKEIIHGLFLLLYAIGLFWFFWLSGVWEVTTDVLENNLSSGWYIFVIFILCLGLLFLSILYDKLLEKIIFSKTKI